MSNQQILFGIDSIMNCCGVLELGGFHYQDGEYDWASRKVIKGKQFSSEKEQIADFNKRFRSSLAHYIVGGGDNSGRYVLIASLVSSYKNIGTGQMPELIPWFKESGWKAVYEFKNQNTGNDVIFFQKLLTQKEIKALLKEHDLAFSSDDDW